MNVTEGAAAGRPIIELRGVRRSYGTVEALRQDIHRYLAGHTVTAIYEVVPLGVELPKMGGVDNLKYQKPANRRATDSPEWMTVKLRYKKPDGDKSSLIELPVKNDPRAWKEANPEFLFAAGVALFGEKLRQSDRVFEPQMTADEVSDRRHRWNDALERAKSWES